MLNNLTSYVPTFAAVLAAAGVVALLVAVFLAWRDKRSRRGASSIAELVMDGGTFPQAHPDEAMPDGTAGEAPEQTLAPVADTGALSEPATAGRRWASVPRWDATEEIQIVTAEPAPAESPAQGVAGDPEPAAVAVPGRWTPVPSGPGGRYSRRRPEQKDAPSPEHGEEPAAEDHREEDDLPAYRYRAASPVVEQMPPAREPSIPDAHEQRQELPAAPVFGGLAELPPPDPAARLEDAPHIGNPQLRESLDRGLAQSAAGHTADLGDFSQFAEEVAAAESAGEASYVDGDAGDEHAGNERAVDKSSTEPTQEHILPRADTDAAVTPHGGDSLATSGANRSLAPANPFTPTPEIATMAQVPAAVGIEAPAGGQQGEGTSERVDQRLQGRRLPAHAGLPEDLPDSPK